MDKGGNRAKRCGLKTDFLRVTRYFAQRSKRKAKADGRNFEQGWLKTTSYSIKHS